MDWNMITAFGFALMGLAMVIIAKTWDNRDAIVARLYATGYGVSNWLVFFAAVGAVFMVGVLAVSLLFAMLSAGYACGVSVAFILAWAWFDLREVTNRRIPPQNWTLTRRASMDRVIERELWRIQ